jgi:hypothetical protein
MTPDHPVSVPYLAGMVAFYCAWSNHVTPEPGLHLNAHGAESVAGWSRFTLALAETGLWDHPTVHPAEVAEADHQCRLLRDIFGNPFRPVTFSSEWRTDTVLTLARQMYASRDFGAMPILADALQDAGCENDDILNHCRGPGPHVRGCWVVDLVLGKE